MLAKIYGPTWEKHNGKRVTLDGLAYVVEVRTADAIYPYPHRSISVHAVPVSHGSKYYREVREELGDHWSINVLGGDGETAVEILRQLGE